MLFVNYVIVSTECGCYPYRTRISARTTADMAFVSSALHADLTIQCRLDMRGNPLDRRSLWEKMSLGQASIADDPLLQLSSSLYRKDQMSTILLFRQRLCSDVVFLLLQASAFFKDMRRLTYLSDPRILIRGVFFFFKLKFFIVVCTFSKCCSKV